LLALVGVVEGVAAQVGEEATHLVGARLALVGDARVGHRALLAREDLRLADVLDPVVKEATEGGDALVLHAVLGDVLRLGEEALELAARLLVGRQKRAIARQEVAALAGLEVDHEPEELLGVVGQLEIVLDEALELLLELFVGVIGPEETDAQDGDDEERAEQDAPEKGALQDTHGRTFGELSARRPRVASA
jgi:hypothetical protein